MKKQFSKILFFIASVFLTSCAGFLPAPEDQPVSDNSAVVALMDTARADIAKGNLDAAVAPLERALRIEPHNALLWQGLSKLRLQQGQYQQAEGLAARSNGWAGSNKALRAENWRIIGEARLKRGDHQGAQAAFDKAATQRN
ncbi:MAG: tetratricopeptide repeat protein [Sulfuricaulis sp.]|uniref:tetratricopeptide repeat protein n=1 Tax=Sulfuricaulis sp. TaxID=2003553 RepID=UPI0025E29937|nr:tetratricopeptide repeat protein [Sulfuricaulis sp.]MCR4347229.1 tetratricopeptide repeat protein [Sulfuricaulis sp.]